MISALFSIVWWYLLFAAVSIGIFVGAFTIFSLRDVLLDFSARRRLARFEKARDASFDMVLRDWHA